MKREERMYTRKYLLIDGWIATITLIHIRQNGAVGRWGYAAQLSNSQLDYSRYDETTLLYAQRSPIHAESLAYDRICLFANHVEGIDREALMDSFRQKVVEGYGDIDPWAVGSWKAVVHY